MGRPRLTHHKIIVSGQIVEALQYAKPVGYGLESSKKKALYRKRRALAEQQTTVSSLSRTRNTLIRLINANARMWFPETDEVIQPQFLTYTFVDENMTSLLEANLLFTNYIKRLNYHIFGTKQSVAKYVVVPEFQKRGVVHYHAIFFNLPMINSRKEFQTGEFATIWEHGFIKKKNISKIPNVGRYMTKYMTKDAMDRRLVGRKKYFSSRGLFKPEIISHQYLADEMNDFLADLTPIHAYITKPSENRPIIENPTFCATYNLSPEQLREFRSFYTLQ